MPLGGKVLMPREFAGYAKRYWSGHELVKAVAVGLGESQLNVGAYNDNMAGKDVVSRDCGVMEINIPAARIGTSVEESLRTMDTLKVEWEPVVTENVAAAYRLYASAGPNDGARRWQPWVAYTTGWATLPAWWTWRHDADHNPVGPWQRTGRYLQRAIVGVANYHVVIAKDLPSEKALELARSHAKHFQVEGELGVQKGIVGWTKVPARPTVPPADGHGPRPVPNGGR